MTPSKRQKAGWWPRRRSYSRWPVLSDRYLLVASVLMATMAAFPRTLTIDDILSLRRLQAVQVSPDGANVAYLVEEPNDELHSKDPILSTLWIAPATPATQTASRLLAKGVIQSPQWAPHSSRCVYPDA